MVNLEQDAALVHCDLEPVWPSAHIARDNLIAAYRATGQVRVYHYSANRLSIRKLVHTLLKNGHKIFVIPESSPVPMVLVEELSKIKSGNLTIHIHVYGDFTLHLPEWAQIENCLKRLRVRFYLPSEAHLGLVSEYLPSSMHSALELCPYPIDESIYSNIDYSSVRKNVLMYAGRIGRQKGCFLLLDWLAEMKKDGYKFELWVAGSFDDVGVPFMHNRDPSGYSYALWNEKIRFLKLEKCVRFLGQLNQAELLAIYQRVKVFVSLSFFHDEEFGLAPLEALGCGIPCILSSWGGFRSLGEELGDVYLCRSELGASGLKMAFRDFHNNISKLLAERQSKSDRVNRAVYFQGKFGVDAVGAYLAKMMVKPSPRFLGFNSFFRRRVFKTRSYRRRDPLFRELTARDPDYRRLYRHYVDRVNGPGPGR